MDRRAVWLTGLASLALAIARLGRLLQPQVEGPDWRVVLVAAAVLGAAITWAGVSASLARWQIVGLNLVGALLAFIRVTASPTLRLGILPTTETLPALGEAAQFALEIIRFGAAPVLPVVGLVGVLTVVFWALGAVFARGVMLSSPFLASVPGLVFYLQLATLDRRPPGLVWTSAFVLVAIATVLTMGARSDPAVGRVRSAAGSLVPRRSAIVASTLAVIMLGAGLGAPISLAETVPESGLIHWRSRSGIGSGLYGGTSLNLFVGLQQQLLSLSDEPMFYARLGDSSPPNSELYWRLITLDRFDGQNWIPGEQAYEKLAASRWEREDWEFGGPTVPVAARVRIASLAEQLLPVLYSPRFLASDVELINDTFRVGEDASIGIDVRTRAGWEYEFRSELPRPDVRQLASLGGELSPIFQNAAESGEFAFSPAPPDFGDRPEDMDRWMELPQSVPIEVYELAREVTTAGSTRFEKALLLESWFRDSDLFAYSVEVTTGHGALDLADWLMEPDSRNYRTGYCEQFATAFAVLARTLGIPSRVVLGFAPGDVEQQADGSDIIVVRERNAHAWVDLWLDPQGWIRFDPTPRSDGINPATVNSLIGFDPTEHLPAPDESRPVESIPDLPQFPDRDFEIDDPGGLLDFILPQQGFNLRLPEWTRWALLGLAVIAAVPATKAMRRRRRMARLRSGDVTAAWEEIVDRLRDLGTDLPEYETAVEIAQGLHPDLVPLAWMYSAAAYGGQPRGDAIAAFDRAELTISQRYGKVRRAYGWVAPSSLIRR